MTLRRRLVIAFVALVTVAVALVGSITYSATLRTLRVEGDRSLASAAAALAAGGTLATEPMGADPDGAPHRPAEGIVSWARSIDPDGTTRALLGPVVPAPVSAVDRDLASLIGGGASRYENVTVGAESFRVYTLSRGRGAGAVQVARTTAESTRVLAKVAVLTLLIGLGVIMLAAAAGWWIARQVTCRLTALSGAAQQVAASGDLTVPIEAHGRDEVGRLAGALRAMLHQLAEAREAQHRLVENAGHELRTPLTSLRTNARVLQRFDELAPEPRRRLLDDVEGELRELTTLVDELVELATDRRNIKPPEPTDIVAVANRVANRIGRRTGARIVIDGEPAMIIAHPQALERAFTNLVENAVKFDGANPVSSVEIVVRAERFAVLDRGPGLAGAELGRLFDRFYRADTARSLPGSGLGLAIVKEVATQHGGAPFARPRPGGGAEIGFTLGARFLDNSELRAELLSPSPTMLGKTRRSRRRR